MSDKTKNSIKRIFSNFFGSLGYLSCTLQWLWILVLYLSPIQGFVESVAPNIKDKPIVKNINLDIDPVILMIIGTIITFFIIVLTLYIIFKMPSSIVKTEKKIVHQTAATVAPIVIQIQKKEPTKRRQTIVKSKLIMWVKFIIVIIPTIFTTFSYLISKQSMNYPVAVFIGLGLTVISLFCFLLQYFLARILKVKSKDVT